VEEGEGERGRWRRARAEDLGHERGWHATELGEVSDDGRAPTLVPAEGVEEEPRERGEAAGMECGRVVRTQAHRLPRVCPSVLGLGSARALLPTRRLLPSSPVLRQQGCAGADHRSVRAA
jgi:hypothetical protein